jgi:hypothetical protein
MTENATDRVIVMEQRATNARSRRDRGLLKRRQDKRTARIEIGYRRYDGRWRQPRLGAGYRKQESDHREEIAAHHVHDTLRCTAYLGFVGAVVTPKMSACLVRWFVTPWSRSYPNCLVMSVQEFPASAERRVLAFDTARDKKNARLPPSVPVCKLVSQARISAPA